MTADRFVHEHGEFDAVLSIVSERRGVSAALVEKDYWVTHSLWALETNMSRVWFKGGTSLAKGFGLIERFSEDLDVKLDALDLPPVADWQSEGTRAVEARRRFFEGLSRRLHVPGARVRELAELRDRSWRNVVFAVHYRSCFPGRLPPGVRPFVQIEVGSARVTPGEERAITSWVHEYLAAEAPDVAATMIPNRPCAIHCVLPAVTLLEKIEAISRRYHRQPFTPADFVRHYEDAARILTAGVGSDDTLPGLLAEMREARDVRNWPDARDPAFEPEADPARWNELETAWKALDPIFWGRRIGLQQCATEVRKVLQRLSEAP